MRVLKLVSLLSLIAFCVVPGDSRADVNAGISLDGDGIKGFYLAIGDHYNVSQDQIIVVRQRNIPDEELPVVFFLARRVGVAPDVIIKLRLGGMSWMEITADFGLSPEIYYIPVAIDPGPPYGKAYGHFKNRDRHEWGRIWLADADIVNFVNLRFISEHYKYSPEDVIKLRQGGRTFVDINAKVKTAKGEGKNGRAASADDKSKEKGKGKGKKK